MINVTVKNQCKDIDFGVDTGSKILNAGISEIAAEAVNEFFSESNATLSAQYRNGDIDGVELFIGEDTKIAFTLSDLVDSLETQQYEGESARFLELADKLESMAEQVRELTARSGM